MWCHPHMVACIPFLIESNVCASLGMPEPQVLGDLFKRCKKTCSFAEGTWSWGLGFWVKKITEQGYGLSFILLSANLTKTDSVFTWFPDAIWVKFHISATFQLGDLGQVTLLNLSEPQFPPWVSCLAELLWGLNFLKGILGPGQGVAG